MFKGMFRSLNNRNYRIWASGAIVSNIGTWMQRTSQDWLVLTELTHNNASAVGIVMALQFGPQFLCLPLTGVAADYFDRRKLIMVTQATMAVLAIALGLLTVMGLVQLWHIYVFAFLFGCTSAFDAPARQSFVSDLVGDKDLPNAVALNSTSFNSARMIGPAVAGIVIATVGTGWSFLINGISFVAVLASLFLLRKNELHEGGRAAGRAAGFTEGFRYVARRDDLRTILIILFLIGTFGLNFPIFISTMSVIVFHVGPSRYGVLYSVMAIGTIMAALLAARREKPYMALLMGGALLFGAGCTLAAVMPNYYLFGAALVLVGISALTLTNASNALMQISTEPHMRGRVMAIRLAIAQGGTPIGAPIVGWVADTFGPRWGLAVAAAGGFVGALVALRYLMRHGEFPLSLSGGRLRFRADIEDRPVTLGE